MLQLMLLILMLLMWMFLLLLMWMFLLMLLLMMVISSTMMISIQQPIQPMQRPARIHSPRLHGDWPLLRGAIAVAVSGIEN